LAALYEPAACRQPLYPLPTTTAFQSPEPARQLGEFRQSQTTHTVSSHTEAMTTLGTTGSDHGAAATGFHANQETVGALTTDD